MVSGPRVAVGAVVGAAVGATVGVGKGVAAGDVVAVAVIVVGDGCAVSMEVVFALEGSVDVALISVIGTSAKVGVGVPPIIRLMTLSNAVFGLADCVPRNIGKINNGPIMSNAQSGTITKAAPAAAQPAANFDGCALLFG
jgi:hypothetical protein